MKRVFFLRYPYRLVIIAIILFAGLGALLSFIPDGLMPAFSVHTGEKIPIIIRIMAEMLHFVRHGL